MASQFLSRIAKTQERGWLQQTYERLTALAIVANVVLVVFDLSYVTARDFWLQGKIEVFGIRQLFLGSQRPLTLSVPLLSQNSDSSFVTRLYDPIKGIEAHPDVTAYLNLVDELQAVALRQGLESAASEEILQQLQISSINILDWDPFRIANKSGRLVQIQNLIVERIPSPNNSARDAFQTFWSAEHLAESEDSLSFFQTRIRPLLETTYIRPIGESGAFVDFFGILDWPFASFFLIEYLIRTWVISRRYTAVAWRDAMLWRWSDIFLFLPFFRLLRVIPLLLRLDQADLLALKRVKSQISQGFVAVIGSDISEIVVLRILNQVQKFVKRGELSRLIAQPEAARAYIDLNGVNELEEIANLVIKAAVYNVLPQVEPEVIAVIQYNLDSALHQMPGYRQLAGIPGVGKMPEQMSQRLAKEITQGVYVGVMAAVEDPVSQELVGRLVQRFMETLRAELSQKREQQEITSLLVDLIEEIKINYVERLSEEDVEEILEQTRALHRNAENREREAIENTYPAKTQKLARKLSNPFS